MKINHFLFVASILLAITFVFSCTNADVEGLPVSDLPSSDSISEIEISSSSEGQPSSSSSVASSSSRVVSSSSALSSSSVASSSSVRPSSSSIPAPQPSNAIVITLTYWETTVTDVGGPDPKIYFNVIAYRNGSQISNNNSNVLLNEQDIAKTWSGSKRSSPVAFGSQADEVHVYAIVVEKDTFFDDDISPGYYAVYSSPFDAGRSGSTTLNYGSGKSAVRYNYEFVRQ